MKKNVQKPKINESQTEALDLNLLEKDVKFDENIYFNHYLHTFSIL